MNAQDHQAATGSNARRGGQKTGQAARAIGPRHSLLLGLAALMSPNAGLAESIPPAAYDVTTETWLPHLEENLRYATTRERRCLSRHDRVAAFPILKHQSLQGCKLAEESRHENAILYLLSCEGGHGTTGDAGAGEIGGTLNVRMGGKNMTFSQRVTAKPVGACPAEANP